MRATHGTAIYTGGGIYNVIGELDNGLWFMGGYDYCSVFDADVRQKDDEDDLLVYDSDWCEEHEIEVDEDEMYSMFEDFCKRLDKKEPGITKGYEEFSNYIAGEVCDYIDFSEFVDYKPKVKEDHKIQVVFTKTIDLDIYVSEEELQQLKKGIIPDRIDELAEEVDNEEPKEFGFFKILEDEDEVSD